MSKKRGTKQVPQKKRDWLILQICLIAGVLYLTVKYWIVAVPIIISFLGLSVFLYIKSPKFNNWVRVRIFKRNPIIQKPIGLQQSPKSENTSKIDNIDLSKFRDDEIKNELLIYRTNGKLEIANPHDIKSVSTSKLLDEAVRRGILKNK